MGKVKYTGYGLPLLLVKFQFPMGKVKLPQSQHLTAD